MKGNLRSRSWSGSDGITIWSRYGDTKFSQGQAGIGLYLSGAAVVDGSSTLCASAGVKVFNYR